MNPKTKMFCVSHKAFSLIELIVVVLLISLLGFLTFSSAIKAQQKQVEVLDPTTLPATLRDAFKGQGDVEFFCINKCKECYVMQGTSITPYDGGINLGTEVELHRLDNNNQFVKLDELGRFKDKKICFRFHLYPNGSSTQMVIVNNQGIYYLPAYFGKAQKVADMDEAKALWTTEEYSLSDSGAYY